MDPLCSSGAIWLHFLTGDTIFVLSVWTAHNLKRPPVPFMWLKALCFPFLTVTFPLSLWFHRAARDLKRRKREKNPDSGGGNVKNRESCWPASKWFCGMNCKVIFISLCNALLVQYEQALFCNTIAMLSHRNALYKLFKRWNWLNLSPNKWVCYGS